MTEIAVYQITEVRTCTVAGDPDRVVLTVRCGETVHHFGLGVSDFMGLAKQMQSDARLLAAPAEGNG